MTSSQRIQSILTFCFWGVIALPIAQSLEVTNVVICTPPYVSQDDINVVRVHRISSPFYEVGNTFHSEGDPFNRDCTRIFWHEVQSKALSAPDSGRGLVWGYIKDLTSWKTYDEYRSAAKPIMKKFDPRDTPEFSFHWSPHSGEENIIYTLRKSDKMVIRINVDTQEIQDVVSYDPGDGRDKSPRACGWTTDKENPKLLVVMQERRGVSPTCDGGFEVDVLKKSKTPFEALPLPTKKSSVESADLVSRITGDKEDEYSDHWRRYQKNNLGSGHGARSPSGRFVTYKYDVTADRGVLDTKTGEFFRDDPLRGGDEVNRLHPYLVNYCNWNASENWFVACSGGEYGAPGRLAFPTRPEVQKFIIWQIQLLGSRNSAKLTNPIAYRKLMEIKSSTGWVRDASKTIFEKDNLKYMEGSRIHVNVSRNGRWIYFLATNGNFHQVDYSESKNNSDFSYVGDNWSSCGVFLAECESAAKVSESVPSHKP